MYAIASKGLTHHAQPHHIRRTVTARSTHRLSRGLEVRSVVNHAIVHQFERCLFSRIGLDEESLHSRDHRVSARQVRRGVDRNNCILTGQVSCLARLNGTHRIGVCSRVCVRTRMIDIDCFLRVSEIFILHLLYLNRRCPTVSCERITITIVVVQRQGLGNRSIQFTLEGIGLLTFLRDTISLERYEHIFVSYPLPEASYTTVRCTTPTAHPSGVIHADSRLSCLERNTHILPNRICRQGVSSTTIVLHGSTHIGLLVTIYKSTVMRRVRLNLQFIRLDGERRCVTCILHRRYHTCYRQSAVRLNDQLTVHRFVELIASLVDLDATGMSIVHVHMALGNDTGRVIRSWDDIVTRSPVRRIVPQVVSSTGWVTCSVIKYQRAVRHLGLIGHQQVVDHLPHHDLSCRREVRHLVEVNTV